MSELEPTGLTGGKLPESPRQIPIHDSIPQETIDALTRPLEEDIHRRTVLTDKEEAAAVKSETKKAQANEELADWKAGRIPMRLQAKWGAVIAGAGLVLFILGKLKGC